MSDAKPDTIPVLWFDNRGRLPSDLALQLEPFRSWLAGMVPASLAIRIRAGLPTGRAETSDVFKPLVGTGFNMHREQVAELHRQLGAWLEANPCPT